MTAVELLLKKGAYPDFKTRDGLTPLSCAVKSGNAVVTELLESSLRFQSTGKEWEVGDHEKK